MVSNTGKGIESISWEYGVQYQDGEQWDRKEISEKEKRAEKTRKEVKNKVGKVVVLKSSHCWPVEAPQVDC